jgi:hypothetical protein
MNNFPQVGCGKLFMIDYSALYLLCRYSIKIID